MLDKNKMNKALNLKVSEICFGNMLSWSYSTVKRLDTF